MNAEFRFATQNFFLPYVGRTGHVFGLSRDWKLAICSTHAYHRNRSHNAHGTTRRIAKPSRTHLSILNVTAKEEWR